MNKDQAIINAYAAGDSYKTVSRKHHHGEEYVRRMIRVHAPELRRTRNEQCALSMLNNPTPRAFAPEDLGLMDIGRCKKCGVPLVGTRKTKRHQTCGLCLHFASGIAA
jgi:hypothetical protein